MTPEILLTSSSITNWRHVKVSPHQGFKTPINEECSGHILSVEFSNPITVEYSLLASIFAQRYYMCVCVCVGLPQWLSDEEFTCNSEATGLIPESGRSLEEGMATHFSFLAWRIP